jgi:hypothetical protein
MGEAGEIRDLISAAAEGATGGVAALRSAGLAVSLNGFAVEVNYAGGETAQPAEVGAVVRLSFACSAEGPAG